MDNPNFDVLAIGRSSIDLYANDIGAPFEEIKSFGAFVGGCPTNISVGVRRLGLKSVLLTALGQDPVGDFVLRFLNDEGVNTEFIPRKEGFRTSAVLLGIQPPDRFPLVFYRHGCADMELNFDDMAASPLDQTKTVLITGTGLSRDPSRSATIWAAQRAKAAGAEVFLDVDFRADQWDDPRAFGPVLRSVFPWVDTVIGTEEEFKALELAEQGGLSISHSQISSPQVEGDTDHAVAEVLKAGPKTLVLKRGVEGADIYSREGKVGHAEPFPVEVVNVLGAGDAFASGYICGHLRGWSPLRAARLGNATGAIVVTRQGCANFMPTMAEVEKFVTPFGGL